ncbi:hypothetical protein [Parasitella parasitica]|uniref:Rho-GAP domain-containing protein n=1 Tax=Parasitella parasitica TaxID=35722 RepID=A0A0B7NEK9_9FUNG|nr:hypothetical protein [Parasitella parasitica]
MALSLQETTSADYFNPTQCSSDSSSDSSSTTKRNSRSLDLISVHPAAKSIGPIARSSSAVEIKILTQNIGNQSMPIQITDQEALLSAVLPSSNISSPASSTTSTPSNTSPTSGSLLFNFGLSAKSCSSRKQSFCSTIIQKEPSTELFNNSNRSRRGSHFSAFSSFTRTSKSSASSTNPLKNLVSRSTGSSSPAASTWGRRYSVSAPLNNPDAAVAMHPLNQVGCEAPAPANKKPTLPMGLQQEINQFAIDGFAKKYFSTHKRGLFRRKVPMTEMLKWTKESIKQPLIMMNKDLYKDAYKCFKMIQMVMGDRQRPKYTSDIEDIQAILTCGITKGQMRDEIYVQTCKQLHDNPSGDSIRKGWELLCIISVTFPPSKNLEAYLTNFVRQNHRVQENQVDIMSQHVSTKLKRICIRGAKGKVLTSAEINRAKEAPFKPSVFGESLGFIMELQQSIDPTLQIPQIVPFLANTVRQTNGQQSEGIFRVSGDADAVTDLRVRIENGNYDASGITDPNVPASLLKYWLRDLAEPIISSEDYDDCIRYAEIPEKAIAIINRLPDTNRRIALFTISFLQEFTDPALIKHTLMNVNNLAMVFAPNFLRCPSESLTTVFENSKYEQAFLRTLINEMKIDPEACAYSQDSTKAIGLLLNNE